MKNLDRYLLLSLFVGYVIKTLVTGAELGDAFVIFFIGAAHFLSSHLGQTTQVSEIKKEISELSEELKAIKKNNEDLRNAVAGVKITQGLRNIK